MIGRFFRRGSSRLVSEGREAYAQGDLERSIERLQAARRNGAHDPEVLHILGVACGKTGRHQAALEVIAEALRLEFRLSHGDDAAGPAALVEMLWTVPFERWRHRLQAIERLGWLYSRTGCYGKWGNALLNAVTVREPARLAPGTDEDAAFATLRLLDFTNNASPAWIEAVFSQVVWPWMRQALEAGRYGLALLLETQAYGAYVLHKESGEHFRKAFDVWTDAMRLAGRIAGEALSPLPASPPADAVPAVAFYLHSGGVLGHTQVLLEFLEAHAQLDRPSIRPLVFLRGRIQQTLAARLTAIGVPYHELDKQTGEAPESDFRALLLVRERIHAERVTAVVWVSIAVHMAFAFSMRLAPVQIWWSMKYHSLEFPEIDGYLTCQSAGSTKLVDGKLWRSAPVAFGDWYRPQLAQRAAEVRSQYAQHELLFGCMGREEKLNSEPYLDAIAEILRACPQAGFLWTGRERSPAVQATLERLGVADRCHFIGWVDTKLYAQVLDIFLDSFPFPCGFTLYETMAAGKPVIVYASAEAAETGFYGLLNPLLSGAAGTTDEVQTARRIFANGKLFHCARDYAQYVEFALALAADPHARERAGNANQEFVRGVLSDRGKMARTVGRHFIELIQEKRTS